ncbi:nucleotidyl transferase AbiEii/AbiGii toxin family protein [Candidatus Bipolaricaulota bacterium]
MFSAHYEAQIHLLIDCLSQLENHPVFALKGGTAINLFVTSMPRLSVDIDLTYLPLKPRAEALREIQQEILGLKNGIERHVPGASGEITMARDEVLKRLVISTGAAVIKIEPNPVFRGSVYPPVETSLCAEAREHFQKSVIAKTLDTADLYGSKLCAALDRQHPRDLFDVGVLLRDQGITPRIRRAFVVYLSGHPGTMHELLNPHFKDISDLYLNHFQGMTDEEIPLETLINIQHQIPLLIRQSLDNDEREFLISVKRGSPKWDILGFNHLSDLPALQWKLLNIARMDRTKHAESLRKLEKALSA